MNAERTPLADVDPAPEPQRWAILGVLVVSLLVVVLDNTVLNIALPTIARDLDASQSSSIWSINSYSCVFAALLFTWGVLGDQYGRKRILVIGLALFGLASAACAFAQTPRSSSSSAVSWASPAPQSCRSRSRSSPSSSRRTSAARRSAPGPPRSVRPLPSGPSSVDFLIEHFWWGSVFLINVPIVIVGVIGIVMLVPETKNPNPQAARPRRPRDVIRRARAADYGILHGR